MQDFYKQNVKYGSAIILSTLYPRASLELQKNGNFLQVHDAK